MVQQETLNPGPGEHQATQRPQRHHVSDRRFAQQDGNLAEEVAAGDARALRPVDDDSGFPVQDDVEPGAGQPLALASGKAL